MKDSIHHVFVLFREIVSWMQWEADMKSPGDITGLQGQPPPSTGMVCTDTRKQSAVPEDHLG